MLTAATLAVVITAHRPVVEEALRYLAPGIADYNLDAIEVQAMIRRCDTADMLLSLLHQMQLTDAFLVMLRARKVALPQASTAPFVPGPAAPDIAIGQVTEGGFDLAELGRFAYSAKAFRCRILIDGASQGSGAFVSPRLVLTAAHVIETVTPNQRLEVLAEDGARYIARKVWHLPCHPDEHTGELPPANTADTHADAALLKLLHPVGLRLAAIGLPQTLDPRWTGPRHLFLVHFPQGEDTGGSPGRVWRNLGDLRLVHDIATEPGSSGGPGFNRLLQFVGLHQGRLNGGNTRRLVPFDRFAANATFRNEITADSRVRAFWSLDGSPNGHLVLGRSLFVDAARALALGELPMLAGLWVRRADIDTPMGLPFTHRILRALLQGLGLAADVTLIPTEQASGDLLANIDTLTAAHPSEARAGVRGDETTLTASDADRAMALMERLGALAAAGRQQWLFFENPPEGLGQRVQFQLEHIVRLALRTAGVRIVLAGFETYGLVDTRFESIADAETSTRPGLLVEILGDTPVADIRATLTEACRDTGLDWSPDIVRHEVDQAIAGLSVSGDRLKAEHLTTVAGRLSEALRKELVA
jgi:hypothetical protein